MLLIETNLQYTTRNLGAKVFVHFSTCTYHLIVTSGGFLLNLIYKEYANCIIMVLIVRLSETKIRFLYPHGVREAITPISERGDYSFT